MFSIETLLIVCNIWSNNNTKRHFWALPSDSVLGSDSVLTRWRREREKERACLLDAIKIQFHLQLNLTQKCHRFILYIFSYRVSIFYLSIYIAPSFFSLSSFLTKREFYQSWSALSTTTFEVETAFNHQMFNYYLNWKDARLPILFCRFLSRQAKKMREAN